MRAMVVFLALTASACGPTKRTTFRGYRHPDVRGIEIYTSSDAAKLDVPGVRWTMELGNTPKDQWIVDYLRAALARGADAVSHIEVHMASDREGEECAVRLDVWDERVGEHRRRPTGYGRTHTRGTRWHFQQSKPVCVRVDQPRNYVTATLYGPAIRQVTPSPGDRVEATGAPSP